VISVTSARSWLRLTENAARDALLAELIAGATAALGHELARYLGEPEAVSEIKPGGSALVLLSDDPTEPENVLIEERSYPTDPWEEADPADYVLESRALRHVIAWPTGAATVRVTYERGYEVDSGPEELRSLVREMVSLAWETRGVEYLGGERLGDYSWSLRDLEKLDGWPRVAARWRRMSA